MQTANDKLLKEVVLQMEKELAMTAIRYEFADRNPTQLLLSLTELLTEADQSHKLADLLYRVDLDYSLNGPVEYPELAEKLWNRVIQKVWFRKAYAKR